jgi:hypothetical protein
VDSQPGERLSVPVRVRGVDQVHVWVYPVDLERLFVREQQVRAVEDISLAGIAPVLETEVDLPLNYGTLAEHSIELDLTNPGAYLILLRSQTVRASSLAIISDLQLDVIEDASGAVLHVSVSNREGAPQEGAEVYAAYPWSGAVVDDTTDLRGMVHLLSFNGSAHVLGRVGESYAVYRGGEIDAFANPSVLYTGWVAGLPDELMRGQAERAAEINDENVFNYRQDVLDNRRSTSNFELW